MAHFTLISSNRLTPTDVSSQPCFVHLICYFVINFQTKELVEINDLERLQLCLFLINGHWQLFEATVQRSCVDCKHGNRNRPVLPAPNGNVFSTVSETLRGFLTQGETLQQRGADTLLNVAQRQTDFSVHAPVPLNNIPLHYQLALT